MYLRFGHEPSKLSASPFLDRNILKNIGLNGAKFLACPWAPCTSGETLHLKAMLFQLTVE